MKKNILLFVIIAILLAALIYTILKSQAFRYGAAPAAASAQSRVISPSTTIETNMPNNLLEVDLKNTEKSKLG